MNDYYLKAADREELTEALEQANLIFEGAHATFRGLSISVIGEMYVPTGNTIADQEGSEMPEMTKIPGYHANIRARELPAALEPLVIDPPSKPYRVWA